MKNNKMITIVCFAIAAVLILNVFNFSLGAIVTSLLPFIVLVCGIVGLYNGKKVIGSILVVVGGIWCLGFLGKWILLLVAAALIYIGVTTMKSKKRRFY